MSKEQQAKELFARGYNCAQAVFGAYCEELGMDMDTAMRLASSFGGGMGRLREVCGAVSGMFLVAGGLYGYDDPDAKAPKKEHYARIQELATCFKEQNGSIVCRELLGLDHKSDEPTPAERTKEYYQKRPCLELVGDAARIMEEYIARQKAEE